MTFPLHYAASSKPAAYRARQIVLGQCLEALYITSPLTATAALKRILISALVLKDRDLLDWINSPDGLDAVHTCGHEMVVVSTANLRSLLSVNQDAVSVKHESLQIRKATGNVAIVERWYDDGFTEGAVPNPRLQTLVAAGGITSALIDALLLDR